MFDLLEMRKEGKVSRPHSAEDLSVTRRDTSGRLSGALHCRHDDVGHFVDDAADAEPIVLFIVM